MQIVWRFQRVLADTSWVFVRRQALLKENRDESTHSMCGSAATLCSAGDTTKLIAAENVSVASRFNNNDFATCWGSLSWVDNKRTKSTVGRFVFLCQCAYQSTLKTIAKDLVIEIAAACSAADARLPRLRKERVCDRFDLCLWWCLVTEHRCANVSIAVWNP